MYPQYNQNYNQNPNQNYPSDQTNFNQGYSQNYYPNTMDPTYQNYQLNTNYGTNYGNQINTQNSYNNGFYIPDEIQVIQKLLTIGMDMYIQAQGRRIGMITQRFKGVGHYFQITDQNNTIVLTARGKLWSLGNDFQVSDAQGNIIGHITQQLVKSLFTFGQIFTVYDANNNQIGSSKQTQIIKTHVDVFNNSNSIQANMVKTPFIKDKWTVKFNGSTIDRRLLIFFPAFISVRQDQQKTNTRINGWEFKF